MLPGKQILDRSITGADLTIKMGIYDETSTYIAGEIIIWQSQIYQVKTGQSVSANDTADLSNSPDLDTANWEMTLLDTEINTVDPTTANDSYLIGQKWINTTNDTAFVLVDNTSSNAVWKQVSNLDVKLYYYNATVGTGGDHATISEAYTAGKYNLKLISNVSLIANINNSVPLNINLNGFELNCLNYTITATANLIISDTTKAGGIVFAKSATSTALCTSSFAYFEDIYITNNSTSERMAVATLGSFKRCVVTIPSGMYTGFAFNNSSKFDGILEDITIIGDSSTYAIYTANNDVTITNLTLRGSFGNMILHILDGCSNYSTASFYISGLSIQNVYDYRPTKVVQVWAHENGSNCNVSSIIIRNNAMYDKMLLTSIGDITYDNVTLDNCKIDTGFTISGDNVSIENCKIATGTITVNATANNTKITNCSTATSIVDNGTNTQIINTDDEQNEFVNSINIPSGSTYKINDSDIFLKVYYDATVGTGGEYATVQAAYAAGKRSLKLISNITETVNLTIASNTLINLNSYNLTVNSCTLYANQNKLEIFNGEITTSGSNSASFRYFTINGTDENLYIHDVTLNCNHTGCFVASNGIYKRITIEAGTATGRALGGGAGVFFTGKGTDITLNINDASLYSVIDMGEGAIINGLKIGGTAPTHIYGAVTLTGAVDNKAILRNASIANTAVVRLTIGNHAIVENIWQKNGTLNLLIYNTTQTEISVIEKGYVNSIIYPASNSNQRLRINNLTVASAITLSGNADSIFTECEFLAGIAVGSDNVSIENCTVPVGTITVNATCDKTTLTGNRTQTSIVDSGTNTTLLANNLI